MDCRRDRLRAATGPLHGLVEQMIERSGLFNDLEGYGHFLAAMHRFHACAEQALREAARKHLAPGWRQPASARLLRGDLSVIGLAPAKPQPVPVLANRGAVLGLRYVTQGSALGATQLLPRALALGVSADRGGAFLTHHAACTREWPDYLSQLEDAELGPAELDSMEDTARQGFELVGDCLRSRCCAMEIQA